MNFSSLRLSITALLLVFGLSSCSSIYYSFWETFGKHKRDLLREHIELSREDQIEVKGDFQDALEVLRATYPLPDSDLQDRYDTLKYAYEEAEDSAEDLRKRISSLNRIAQDLFEEWADEAQSMNNSSLRRKSLVSLNQMERGYEGLYRSLLDSEERLDPVLNELRDHVLFLKHNLNSTALGALQVEASNIERDISGLVAKIEETIADTDSFLQTLE